jgi:hypothetical protein
MNMKQLGQILESAGQIYRDAGNIEATQSLVDLLKLFDGHQALSVSKFSALIEKVTTVDEVHK